MAPSSGTLEARVLQRLAQKAAEGRTVAQLVDPPVTSLLPPRPPSSARPFGGGFDGVGGRGAGGRGGRHSAALSSEEDYWPEQDDDASDSDVSTASSSDGLDEQLHPRPARGQVASAAAASSAKLRSRGSADANDAHAPLGKSKDKRGKLQARVMPNYAGDRGGGDGASSSKRSGGRRKDADLYDCEGGGGRLGADDDDGGASALIRSFLNGGGKFCNKKDLARFVRRRRRTIKTTLAAVLGMYIAGLFLASQGAFESDSLNEEVPRSAEGFPPEEMRMPEQTHLSEEDRHAQLEEMRRSLPMEAWRAAGLGDPPHGGFPKAGDHATRGALPLRERSREASR